MSLRERIWGKMSESEKNRRLRLEQVRQQSKKMAHSIRQRVSSEKQKQEEKIRIAKAEEMNKWKRRQFEQKGKQFAGTLALVGEAHAAAEKEKLLPAVPRARKKPPEKVKKAKIAAKSTETQTSPREEPEVISLTTSTSESDSSTLVDDLQLISSSDSLEKLLCEISNSKNPQSKRDTVVDLKKSSDKVVFSEVSNLIKRKNGVQRGLEGSLQGNRESFFSGVNLERVEDKMKLGKSPPSRDLSNVLGENRVAKKIAESPQTIHHYDHRNRFHKNYIPQGNIVTKAGSSRNQNAMENAREEVQRMKYSAKLKDVENEERRRVQKMRSNQALEKERLRRNYEDLLAKVDELLDREENAEGEDLVLRSEDTSEPIDVDTTKKTIGKKTESNDIDVDLNLMDILGKILHKLDENKMQIVEEIMSKTRENRELTVVGSVESHKEVAVQSEIMQPEKDTEEVEIQTVGQSDKVEIVPTITENANKKPQIQIVINVKETPKVDNLSRIPDDVQKVMNNEKRKHSVTQMNLSDAIGKKYPKTPEKRSAKILIDTISSITSDGSSRSTVYHSPPNAICSDLSHFVRGFGEEKVTAKAPRRRKEAEKGKKSAMLRKYIKQLVDMPRADVDLLSVSSGTEVPTPNCSVVNVPANAGTQSKWIPLREEGEKKSKSKKTTISTEIHPKKCARRAREPVEEAAKEAVKQPEALREEYAEQTKRYVRKISELSKLINKVRSEKSRLVAEKVGISSGSDNGVDTSTKYKDFPSARVNVESSTDMSSVSEMKDDEGRVSVNNLTASKVIGVSKDSGISISRPVTSTEMRDSPEIRWTPLRRTRAQDELSTIAEMDTLGTSRIHASPQVNGQSKVDEAFDELKHAIERISADIEDYQKFPSFEEYVKHLGGSLQDQSMEQKRKLLEYFKELSQDMVLKNFPGFGEFVQEEATGDAESADLEGASEFTLPDVVAELIQRKVMDQPFRNPSEERTNTQVLPSSSGSSINLEADFRKLGLGWAANMLERTHERQQLSSSDSSTQLNIIPNLTNATHSIDESRVMGKPLNLRDFFNRELEKKAKQDNSYSADGSSLTNTLLKSLLDAEVENHIHRTSTPVALGGKKSTEKHSKNSSSSMISSESKLSSIGSLKE
ncbi:uncharacterized protein LOC132258180 [Phlebotomus argentipes]|uniref:uncharacterized protein LOC132258180 n=1 Tax=Phlebotomus argentipes TaxID=94469 RepID=UPI0028935EC3|nr:uncharacterized protein LOC132258180 [Phlebotomus argentipes]